MKRMFGTALLAALLAVPATSRAQTAPTVADAPFVDGWATAPGPPPELPKETPTDRPFPEALWTSGFWVWDGSTWSFQPGEWVAPMAGYDFVNGWWEDHGDTWRWMPGGWAREGTLDIEIPTQIAVASTPPAPRVEVRTASPGYGWVWTNGYWFWGAAGWTWIAGGWLQPPRTNVVWVAPRWHQVGVRWVFIGGGWRGHGHHHHHYVPVYRHRTVVRHYRAPRHFDSHDRVRRVVIAPEHRHRPTPRPVQPVRPTPQRVEQRRERPTPQRVEQRRDRPSPQRVEKKDRPSPQRQERRERPTPQRQERPTPQRPQHNNLQRAPQQRPQVAQQRQAAVQRREARPSAQRHDSRPQPRVEHRSQVSRQRQPQGQSRVKQAPAASRRGNQSARPSGGDAQRPRPQPR